MLLHQTNVSRRLSMDNNNKSMPQLGLAQQSQHGKRSTKKRPRTIYAYILIFLFLILAFVMIVSLAFVTQTANSTSQFSLPLFFRTSPSSPSNIVSYKLIKGLQINNTFDPYYVCKADKHFGPRISTSPLFSAPNILDFQTQITSSLKILILGDSVGIQLSQALQESMGATIHKRKVLKYAWRKHEGVHLATDARGGGMVAGYRITGMFQNKQKNNKFQLAPVPGGGWMQEHVDLLKEALVNATRTKTSLNDSGSGGNNASDSEFDVVILQFPYGWLERPKEEAFTPISLKEAVDTSHRVFGAKTVILQTVPMQNNYENLHRELIYVNNAIEDFVKAYQPPADGSGVQSVLLMDLAFLSMNLFVHNAVGMDMVPSKALDILDSSDSLREKEGKLVDYLNKTLEQRLDCCNPEYKEVVAFSCGVPVKSGKYCQRNMYSFDGMHWCMVSFVCLYIIQMDMDAHFYLEWYLRVHVLTKNLTYVVSFLISRIPPVGGYMGRLGVCSGVNMITSLKGKNSEIVNTNATVPT